MPMNKFGTRHLAKFLIVSSAALGLPSGAFAQGMPMPIDGPLGMHGPMGMRGGGPEMMLRGLDLTEAQRDQIFKIHHDQAPVMYEQTKLMRRAREELMQAGKADRFDEARARQAADALARAVSTMAVMRTQTMSRVRAVLTPEQRRRLDEHPQRRAPSGGPKPPAQK
jgi:Spy/CpxP family protein refolding chaperone